MLEIAHFGNSSRSPAISLGGLPSSWKTRASFLMEVGIPQAVIPNVGKHFAPWSRADLVVQRPYVVVQRRPGASKNWRVYSILSALKKEVGPVLSQPFISNSSSLQLLYVKIRKRVLFVFLLQQKTRFESFFSPHPRPVLRCLDFRRRDSKHNTMSE